MKRKNITVKLRSRIKENFSFLIAFLFCLQVFVLGSCKKFVEVSPSDTQLLSPIVFNNEATATAALTAIYGKMLRNAGLYGIQPNMSFMGGLSSDELKNYSTDPTQIEFYTNSLTKNSSYLASYFWGQSYQYIYMANSVLEGLSNSSTITSGVKQQLSGEAKFIRAFCHFYLVNLFGDVPLVTSTTYQLNASASRTVKAQVYQQIITDLKDAKAMLLPGYVKSDNTVYSISSAERIRPNKFTAAALLSRVYLYIGDYSNAELEATTVIGNFAMYSLVLNLNNVFLKNSTEAIWQLQAVNLGNINTYDGNRFILTGIPNNVTLSDQLLNAFELNDGRKSNWVNSITVGVNTYYYPYKYKVKSNVIMSEALMVLRLAEQYLIRAEARAQQDNIFGSQADLNAVRARAGLLGTTAMDKGSLLLAIEHERQVELFTEWGHRWLDIKRTNRTDAILLPIKGANWQATAVLYPIPLLEMQNNPNLTQNAGY